MNGQDDVAATPQASGSDPTLGKPSQVLRRAAERLDGEAGVVTRPISAWLRDIADELGERGVQTYYEEHAVTVAVAILRQPAECKERSDHE